MIEDYLLCFKCELIMESWEDDNVDFLIVDLNFFLMIMGHLSAICM